MSRAGRRPPGDLSRELQQEIILTLRAERRLREHELTRRRTLLVLAVALSLVAVVLASVGHVHASGAIVAGGLASGAAAIPRRTPPRK
jgi:uncharacterized membrane protein